MFTYDWLTGFATGIGVGTAIVSVYLGRLWSARVRRTKEAERRRCLSIVEAERHGGAVTFHQAMEGVVKAIEVQSCGCSAELLGELSGYNYSSARLNHSTEDAR